MQSERGESSDDDIESSTDLEKEETDVEQDLDEKQAKFTFKPVPGFEEVVEDLFQVREGKKKPFAYALAHRISADAAMSQGILQLNFADTSKIFGEEWKAI